MHVAGIGKRIKELRLHLEMNQADFGIALGVTASAVSHIEIGDHSPDERTIRAICVTWGINREWLETGKGETFRDDREGAEDAAYVKDILAQLSDDARRKLGAFVKDKGLAELVDIYLRIDDTQRTKLLTYARERPALSHAGINFLKRKGKL